MKKSIRNLVIDIGNTRIKSGYFTNGELMAAYADEELSTCLGRIASDDFDNVLISSVKYTEPMLRDLLPFPFLLFGHNTPVPIKNKYETPHTLGLDRLAAVIGAWALASGGPLLSVDMGSCITYDLLESNNEYIGGAISPGINMRAEAMHKLTAKLPKVAIPTSGVSFIGTTTQTCMQSGVYFGVCEEIKGFINRFEHAYPKLKVFICGGDANYFESLTKDHIFVIPNLVLYGLDRILTYNVEK